MVIHFCICARIDLNMNRYKTYGDFADVVNWGCYETNFPLEEGKTVISGYCCHGGLANRGVLWWTAQKSSWLRTKKNSQGVWKKGFILGLTVPFDGNSVRKD